MAHLWHTPRGKAMLGKAVAELKQDKPKALEMFNKGEGGLKDRDVYHAIGTWKPGTV